MKYTDITLRKLALQKLKKLEYPVKIAAILREEGT